MAKHLAFGLGGLVLGVAVGFFGANAINRGSSPAETGMQAVVGDATLPQRPDEMLPDVTAMLKRAETEPQSFAVQMRTGDMYARIGKFDKAVEFYSKGLALKPQDFNANVVIANAYFDSGQFEKAAEHYSKAIEINPADNNARADLGAALLEAKPSDFDRAIREFESVLAKDPNHASSLYYLGIVHSGRGDVANAQKMLSRLEQSNPNSDLIPRLRDRVQAGTPIQ